jgi:hypothetical protein
MSIILATWETSSSRPPGEIHETPSQLMAKWWHTTVIPVKGGNAKLEDCSSGQPGQKNKILPPKYLEQKGLKMWIK